MNWSPRLLNSTLLGVPRHRPELLITCRTRFADVVDYRQNIDTILENKNDQI